MAEDNGDEKFEIELSMDDIDKVFERFSQMAGAASIELTAPEVLVLICSIRTCIQDIEDYRKEHPDEERDYESELLPLQKLQTRLNQLIDDMAGTAADNDDGDFLDKFVAEKLEDTGREYKIEPPAESED